MKTKTLVNIDTEEVEKAADGLIVKTARGMVSQSVIIAVVYLLIILSIIIRK